MKAQNIVNRIVRILFFLDVSFLFFDGTLMIQKWYLQNPINLAYAMALLNAMLGLAESASLLYAIKRCKQSKLYGCAIAIFCIAILFFAFGFATMPKVNDYIMIGIILSFASVFVIMICQIKIIISLLKTRQ